MKLKIKLHCTICHCGVHEEVLSHSNEYLQHLYCHTFFTFWTNSLDLFSGSVKIGVNVSFRNLFVKVGIQRRWEKSSLHVCTQQPRNADSHKYVTNHYCVMQSADGALAFPQCRLVDIRTQEQTQEPLAILPRPLMAVAANLCYFSCLFDINNLYLIQHLIEDKSTHTKKCIYVQKFRH